MGWRVNVTQWVGDLMSNINQIYERRKRSNEPEEERVASTKKDKIKIDKKARKGKKKNQKRKEDWRRDEQDGELYPYIKTASFWHVPENNKSTCYIIMSQSAYKTQHDQIALSRENSISPVPSNK